MRIKKGEQMEQRSHHKTQVRQKPEAGRTRPHLGQVVMDIESGQLGEVSVQAQGHKKARILIGQLSVLRLIVRNPG